MNTLRRSILLVLSLFEICLVLAAAVKPAHAYVDPGSGLLFFQVGGSMLAGALFVLRTKIRKLFGWKPKPGAEGLQPLDENSLESPVRSGTHG